MKMIFNYDANKTHFHNKGFALSLVLKVRFFGTRKWPISSPDVKKEEVRFAYLPSNHYKPFHLSVIYGTVLFSRQLSRNPNMMFPKAEAKRTTVIFLTIGIKNNSNKR